MSTVNILLNPTLARYNEFARANKYNDDAISHLSINSKNGHFVVEVAKESRLKAVSNWELKLSNDKARNVFFNGIVEQFGGADKIPQKVLQAMYKKDFKDVRNITDAETLQSRFVTCKPLRARHIEKIMCAVAKESSSNHDLRATQLAANFLYDLNGNNDLNFRKSLRELFAAALPRKLESAKHINAAKLEDFGADNLSELKGMVNIWIDDVCGDFDDNTLSIKDLISEVKKKLKSLSAIFQPSKTGRGTHVNTYLDAFTNVAANMKGKTGHDYDMKFKTGYDYDMKFKTYSQMIKDYDFNPETVYNTTDNTSAKKFIKDLLCAAALGSEGNLEFGDANDSQDEKFKNWLKSKLTSLVGAGGLNSSVLDSAMDVLNHDGVKNLEPLGKAQHVFKQLKPQLELQLKNQANRQLEGKTTDNITPLEWLEKVISEVESFKGTNLETLMRRHGVTAKFNVEERTQFDHIAQCAFGSGRYEGHKGGAGYIGLSNNGTAFKFLRTIGERMRRTDDLTEDEKKQVEAATRKLRERLTAFAKKISPRVEKIVTAILARKEDGLDLLRRTDVADAIDCMAPYMIDQDGKGSEWKNLKTTAGESYSDLHKVATASGFRVQNP